MKHKVTLSFDVENIHAWDTDGDDSENITIQLERLHTRHIKVINERLLKMMHKLNKELEDENLVCHRPTIKIK